MNPWAPRIRCFAIAMLLCEVVFAGADMVGAQTSNESPAVTSQTSVGVQGVYYLRDSGSRLQARPVDENAPLVLRISEITPVDGGTLYELFYIGQEPGEYDLRDYLRRTDGRPLEGVDPIRVMISGVLPQDHDGAMVEIAQPAMPAPGGYRYVIWAAIVVWIAPLIVLIGRKLMVRPREALTDQAPGATLADQLQPLVEQAIAGQLDAEDQARLERLLIGFWRDRLDLHGLSAVEAIGRMKAHNQAGALLNQLENWLHRRPVEAGMSSQDLALLDSVLSPYRRIQTV